VRKGSSNHDKYNNGRSIKQHNNNGQQRRHTLEEDGTTHGQSNKGATQTNDGQVPDSDIEGTKLGLFYLWVLWITT
jgi:hypothetical protein